jgi:hypothetical protein
MSYVYRFLYGIFYYMRLIAMKLKFLWAILPRTLLVRTLYTIAKNHKLYAFVLIYYASYYLHFRNFFIDAS